MAGTTQIKIFAKKSTAGKRRVRGPRGEAESRSGCEEAEMLVRYPGRCPAVSQRPWPWDVRLHSVEVQLMVQHSCVSTMCQILGKALLVISLLNFMLCLEGAYCSFSFVADQTEP